MFELPTELLPYFFVLQTLMMEGVVPWVDLSGLLIGYAWEVGFCTPGGRPVRFVQGLVCSLPTPAVGNSSASSGVLGISCS